MKRVLLMFLAILSINIAFSQSYDHPVYHLNSIKKTNNYVVQIVDAHQDYEGVNGNPDITKYWKELQILVNNQIVLYDTFPQNAQVDQISITKDEKFVAFRYYNKYYEPNNSTEYHDNRVIIINLNDTTITNISPSEVSKLTTLTVFSFKNQLMWNTYHTNYEEKGHQNIYDYFTCYDTKVDTISVYPRVNGFVEGNKVILYDSPNHPIKEGEMVNLKPIRVLKFKNN